jgi:hypothetical protein
MKRKQKYFSPINKTFNFKSSGVLKFEMKYNLRNHKENTTKYNGLALKGTNIKKLNLNRAKKISLSCRTVAYFVFK